MKIIVLTSLLMGVLAACGSDSLSPREACEQGATELCGRIYACYTEAELAALGFPASEAACVTTYQQTQGCAAQTEENTCTGNETYHASEAATCVDQIGGLSCAQVRDSNLEIDVAAPACGKVCVVD